MVDPGLLFKIGGGVAVAAIVSACLSTSYQPLVAQMHERFLESEGRAQWQIEQRAAEKARAEQQAREAAERAAAQAKAKAEADARAAAEQARAQQERERQAAVEQERLRQQVLAAQRQQAWEAHQYAEAVQKYPALLAAFRAADAEHSDAINRLLREVQGAKDAFSRGAGDPAFYQRNHITPDQVSTDGACSNPSNLDYLFDSTGNRTHNSYLCAVYYGVNPDAAKRNPVAHNLITALAVRLNHLDLRANYPAGIMLAYLWRERFRQGVEDHNVNIYLPPLIYSYDGHVNYQLFNSVMSSDFAGALVNSMTTEEIIAIRTKYYPALERFSSAASDLRNACQTLKRVPCMPSR